MHEDRIPIILPDCAVCSRPMDQCRCGPQTALAVLATIVFGTIGVLLLILK